MYIFVIMAKSQLDQFEILNLRHLARKSKIKYSKILNCINGRYNSLTEQEETMLYNAIREEVEKSTLVFGFTFDGKRIKART